MTPTRRELTRTIAAHKRAAEQLSQARASLHSAIVAELTAGVTQTELVTITGYSREQLRRIARDAGLPRA